MGVVRNIVDGLANVVTGLGTRSDARMARAYISQQLSRHQIEQSFEASAMLRKAITIPATDRVRAWRDWQADNDQIELLEAEEERHQLQAKVRQAEILRGLGGGALILVGAGDTAMPLKVTAKGGLVAINVVSRWHLSGQNWVDDLSRADYGTPEYWTMAGTTGQTRLHPSRVVCFHGEPLPSVWNGDWEKRFWGNGRVPSLMEPAQNLDEALATFSALIKDALNVDIGIPGLLDMVGTAEGESALMKRLGLMIQGSSVFNGRVYDRGDAEGKGGESIDRHQVAWTGIPELIRAYVEALCAAADIPVTRFWGTSAKGLNATGEGDDRNWKQAIETGQRLELKSCLDAIDAALIPSALGARPDEVWWQFAPLSIPTEKEETERFYVWTQAMEKVGASGAIPDVAFSKAYQNGLIEGGWTPGLEAALEEVPENERFPEGPTEEEIRAEIEAETARAQQAANDAAPRTLYVQRKLLNTGPFIAWAKAQGFETTTAADDLHVTITYSRQAVDWMKMGSTWDGNDKGELIVPPGGARIVEPLGDKGVVVLLFNSSALSWRHEEMVRNGASHDYDEYQPHVTITYEKPDGLDLSAIEPFRGELRFGPEIFEELTEGWRPTEDGGSRTSDRPFEDGRVYRRDKRGRFARSNGSALSISNFLAGALKNPGDHSSLEIGTAGGKSPEHVHGYARRIHAGHVQHALKQHGDRKREVARGQLPLVRSDIAKVPQIIERAHSVKVNGPMKRDGMAQSITYIARIGAREYGYVETVGTKRQQVVFKTMWKK